ncbi:MAG: FKBP-type peptidyl-prolyl cis-trans isomerase N-terminal domain-containing protein, partial [Pirellulales bacterium]
MQRCLLTLILGLGLCALSGGGLAAGPREAQADESQADASQADENQADENQADESQADKVELVVPDEPDAPDEQDEGESEAKDGEEAGAAEKRLDEGGSEAGGSIRLVDPSAKDLLERVSYVFGLEIGQEIKRRGVAVDLELLSKGIQDGAAGTPAVSPQEIEATMMAFNSMRQAERKALAEKNKKEEERFLAANKKKKGVKTLPSGLQYKVVKR